MKIQIIALGMTDQSHRIFYNTQDMGLGICGQLPYALSAQQGIRISFHASV